MQPPRALRALHACCAALHAGGLLVRAGMRDRCCGQPGLAARLPATGCCHSGRPRPCNTLQTFSGGMPAKLTEQLDGAVQEYGSSGGGWMMRILTALVVVGAAAGGEWQGSLQAVPTWMKARRCTGGHAAGQAASQSSWLPA